MSKGKRSRSKQEGKPSPGTPQPDAPRALHILRWRWLLLLAGGSMLLQVLIYPPIDLWPLAYVCFVPWLLMVGASESAHRSYVMSYLMGVAFFSISMGWLFIVTVLGSVVLFLAMALYYPLAACPIRHVIRRRRLPLAILFPFIWTGCEALRSIVVPRFPWSLLGHSQHTVLSIIQVSDLVGAYGVTFVVAAINGLIADIILTRYGWPVTGEPVSEPKSLRVSGGFAGVVLLAAIVYGQVQLHRGTSSEGPRIAIIQGNYPNYVDPAMVAREPSHKERAMRYFELLHDAAKEEPDLFLLPETPWVMYLNHEFLEQPLTMWYSRAFTPQECYEALQSAATDYDAYVVTGSASLVPTPYDLRAPELRYNSAFVFSPDGGPPGRYDKNHLVLIGEYVPFRFGELRFLYLWLNNIVPFGSDDYDYSLSAGEGFRTFSMKARTLGDREFHFGTPICYENVMPYISRRFVTGDDGKKRCDFLLNLSNDGWFLHSAELPQHLAASVFRAVENRVGVARAVNTGISCFVDPDGRVHHVVSKNGVVRGPDVDGYQVARVKVDSRQSLYSRHGDWFAIICAALWAVFYLDYVVHRARMG